MVHRNIYLLICIGSIFILQVSARVYRFQDDDSNEFEPMKRFQIFGKNTGKSGYSNWNRFCQPNICGEGECISLLTTYYCQCPSDRYGAHCEKLTRNIVKRQSFHDFFEQLKRILNKPEDQKSDDDNERTYYDSVNGVSF